MAFSDSTFLLPQVTIHTETFLRCLLYRVRPKVLQIPTKHLSQAPSVFIQHYSRTLNWVKTAHKFKWVTMKSLRSHWLEDIGTPMSSVLDLQSSENIFTLLPNLNWSLLQNKTPSFSFTHAQDYWLLGLQSQQLQSHCIQMDFSNTK